MNLITERSRMVENLHRQLSGHALEPRTVVKASRRLVDHVAKQRSALFVATGSSKELAREYLGFGCIATIYEALATVAPDTVIDYSFWHD